MLIGVKSVLRFKRSSAENVAPKASDRLKRLARNLDALARRDEESIRQAHQIGALRRAAACELHKTCNDFVAQLNRLLTEIKLEFDPERYGPDNFRDSGLNLFQINANGRILQLGFEATGQLISTEDFRVPYTLSGQVRCFNQELLEKDLIEEQLLFYTMEGKRNLWRFFDARTYRSGPCDAEYLAGLLEQLV